MALQKPFIQGYFIQKMVMYQREKVVMDIFKAHWDKEYNHGTRVPKEFASFKYEST